jgi:hypothetical protein
MEEEDFLDEKGFLLRRVDQDRRPSTGIARLPGCRRMAVAGNGFGYAAVFKVLLRGIARAILPAARYAFWSAPQGILPVPTF